MKVAPPTSLPGLHSDFGTDRHAFPPPRLPGSGARQDQRRSYAREPRPSLCAAVRRVARAERATIDAAGDDGHSVTGRRSLRRSVPAAQARPGHSVSAAAHPMACTVRERATRFDALLWRRNGNDAPVLAEADDFPAQWPAGAARVLPACETPPRPGATVLTVFFRFRQNGVFGLTTAVIASAGFVPLLRRRRGSPGPKAIPLGTRRPHIV